MLTIPDADTLLILAIGCGLLVLQVLDWCGCEWWREPGEAKGFEVVRKGEGRE